MLLFVKGELNATHGYKNQNCHIKLSFKRFFLMVIFMVNKAIKYPKGVTLSYTLHLSFNVQINIQLI